MGRPKGTRRTPGPKRPPLTHFLCLPLITPDSKPALEQSLKQFTNHVCPDWVAQGPALQEATKLHPKAIRPVGSLHLTLGVMSLKEEQLAAAIEFLSTIDLGSLLNRAASSGASSESAALHDTATTISLTEASRNLETKPIQIDLKGLESMHSPTQTSILYASPQDDTHRLYPFCAALQRAFQEQGFLIEDNRKLKLHATIVNTIYAKGKGGPRNNNARSSASNNTTDSRAQAHGPNANALLKLDARPLLDTYRDHVWAEHIVLDRVAICEMGAKKILDAAGAVVEERYTEVAKRNLR